MDAVRLAGVPLFDGMPARLQASIASMMREEEVVDGTVLLAQGQRDGGVFLVLEGGVRVVRQVPGGGTVHLATLGPGAVLGTHATVDGGGRGASVVARGETRVAVLRRLTFEDLMAGQSAVALGFQLAVIRDLAADVQRTNRRLVELASLPDQSLSLEALTGRLYGSV